ncbi:hypothetical protein SISNIDRAFT_490244 [Sistotremastrum niveocremeum HHB9708]|uniref:Uncharacterized protein n=1 Tax=Sistotremastrum niveocremeum HHB9708 TaxID=1314777 RepID=A0A164P7R7_9AGAM|nr:hypothetical protein SISNIDRAFT_490244 [Sistotremastrum niveocremeum HHB9708]
MQLFSPALISHTFNAATAPLLIDAGLDLESDASPEDSLLHPLLCRVQAEAYRLASLSGPDNIQEADQYMLDIQNKIWNSMSVVRAHVNAALNRRVPIARLPNEILGKIFEFYMVGWFEKFRFIVPSGKFPLPSYYEPNLLRKEWYAILQVCQTWRHVATTTPTLFTTLDLHWHPSIIDFFLQCNGTTLPLCIHIPEFSQPFRASLEILCQTRRTEDKAELLRALIARTQELYIEDAISFTREFRDGLHAPAPLLRSLTMTMSIDGADGVFIPENPMTVYVESGDLRNHLFRDMTVQLQTLELSGFGFTKDWLACINLRSVSIQFYDDWYQLTRSTSPFTYLAELPNLEILHFSDSGEYSPAVSQVGSVFTFNRLHTLTFKDVIEETLRDAFTTLNLPALQEFNLLCGFQRHNHYMWGRDNPSDPFFTPWECTWLHRIIKRATHIQLSLAGPNAVRDIHEHQNSGVDYATLMFMESSGNKLPLFKMTWDGNHGYMNVNEDPLCYNILLDSMTHCLRHWVSSIPSMSITGIDSRKTLPPVIILRPFFMKCLDLTSLTVENCDAGSVIAALSSVDVADIAAPGIRELRLQGCLVDAEDLESLLREREALGFAVTQTE